MSIHVLTDRAARGYPLPSPPTAKPSVIVEEKAPFELVERLQEVFEATVRKIGMLLKREVTLFSGHTCKGKEHPLTECLRLNRSFVIISMERHEAPCTSCGSRVESLIPIFNLNIPTFSHFQNSNEKRTEAHLKAANDHFQKKQYRKALAACQQAFIYTNESRHYSLVPEIFAALNEKLPEILSYLYLAMHQIQEGRTPEAINTLKTCEKLGIIAPKLDQVLAGLTLSLEQLQISAGEWTNPVLLMKRLPPYPHAMKEFLDGDCTIYSGRKRRDTHFVVPLTKNITYIRRGSLATVPRTVSSIDEFDKVSGGKGCKYIWHGALPSDIDKPAEVAFEWAVMTMDPLPDTKGLTEAQQEHVAQLQGYQIPNLCDALTCILWAARNGIWQSYSKGTYISCEDKRQDRPMCVGAASSSEGLDVVYISPYVSRYGIAGIKKF